MKLQNVYVGQFLDIRHGAVYSDIREAVKELTRPMQAGMVMQLVYLPDSERYWIVGTLGKSQDARFHNIHLSSTSAEQAIDALRAKGWPNSQLLCKELKIIPRGPNEPDIKTQAHLSCEQELFRHQTALQKGVFSNNSEERAPISLDHDTYLISPEFKVEKIDQSSWRTPNSYIEAMITIRNAATLLRELSIVDPDAQPNKWKRLQSIARTFAGIHENPSEDSPKDSSS